MQQHWLIGVVLFVGDVCLCRWVIRHQQNGHMGEPESRWLGSRPRAREAIVLTVGAVVYFGGRVLVEGGADASTRNAQRLIDLEQRLGLDIELSVQRWALDHDSVRIAGNLSYVWLHWPLLLTVLWLLFNLDRTRYRQLRNAMFASGVCGLGLFAFFPMAPPRFMPGFVGTVSDDARRHYLSYPLSWTNRFAAFPSFHVGWTLIACLALASTLHGSSTRTSSAVSLSNIAVLVPAALVAFAVISTANHYVIDATVGALIASTAYLVAGRLNR